MKKVEQKWDLLKQEIQERRSSGNPWPLFYSSQEYYILVNETAFSAELFSERQLIRSIGILSGAIIIFFIFVIFSLIYYKWSISIRNRAETLNQIAFIDPLTKIPNRAGCEQFIKEVKETSSGENLTAIMFDMNNLKIINDFLGHSEGDKIIANFASILYNEVKDHGFIGRYGGDEFLAVFKNKNQTDIESFLLNINKRIGAHNNLCPNELQKISFSAGHVIDNTLQTDIEEMIKRADKKLYVQRWRKVEGT
jgi:diguanylate cyclase (GGDEF)-like protein